LTLNPRPRRSCVALSDIIHPEDLSEVQECYRSSKAAEAETSWTTVHYRRARKDGSWAHLETHMARRSSIVYTISREASVSHEAHVVLRSFLQSTSFDLRSSATDVLAASALLSTKKVSNDPEAAVLADAIKTSCNMLIGLSSSVLELRKLERGELTVNLAPFNVREVVSSVLEMCNVAWGGNVQRGTATPPSPKVVANASDALPAWLEGDASLLSLIIQNLVVNAIKFSPGGTEVKVRIASDHIPQAPPGQVMLRVEVADRGIGIAADKLERIFAKFEHTSAAQGGGKGLGLHLSRGFARAMRGEITVISQEGHGSTFTLTVPVRILQADVARRAAMGPMFPQSSLVGAQEPPEVRAKTMGVGAVEQSSHFPLEALSGASKVSLDDMLLELLKHTKGIFMVTHPNSADNPVARIQYVSQSVRAVLGWAPEQLLGRPVETMLHAEDVDGYAQALAAMQAAGTSCALLGVRRLACEDGGFTWMHLECVSDGGHHYCLWRNADKVMESASALKSYLLATSHDMRTPVTGITVAAQLLADRPSIAADPEASFLVQTIRSCASLMLGVINNVLDLRNLEEENVAAGRSRAGVAPTTFDPRKLVDELLSACGTALGVHVRDVKHNLGDPDLPKAVEADLDSLTRILQNVLITLLRHAADMRALSVHLRVAEGELTLEAADAACHLSHEYVEQMWAPFFVSTTSRGLHNSGLGLCVARYYAGAMGGTLVAARMDPLKAPCGVVLRLRVPARIPVSSPLERKASPPTAATEAAQGVAGETEGMQTEIPSGPDTPKAAAAPPHLLLVEDHELNRKLVSKLLQRSGFRVSTAGDGAEALAQLQHGDLPAAVLCDIQMPVMDGLQFARAFREWEAATKPHDKHRLPIIALSANVLDEHVRQCYAAGMSAHLAKPLRADAVASLREWLTK